MPETLGRADQSVLGLAKDGDNTGHHARDPTPASHLEGPEAQTGSRARRRRTLCKRRRSPGATGTFLPIPDEHRGFPTGCKRANCYRCVAAVAPEFSPIIGLGESETVGTFGDSGPLLPACFALIGNSSFNFRKCFWNRFQLSQERATVTAVATTKNTSCAGTCDPRTVRSALGSKTKSRSKYLTGWLNR